FVNRFLTELGATVTHEVDGFVSADLPPALAEDFSGRSSLHLAFTRAALDHHPDAELCAVGSEVFEEILLALRFRGDLNADLAVAPIVSATSPIPHVDSLRLIERDLVAPSSWRAEAAWKVTSDG